MLAVELESRSQVLLNVEVGLLPKEDDANRFSGWFDDELNQFSVEPPNRFVSVVFEVFANRFVLVPEEPEPANKFFGFEFSSPLLVEEKRFFFDSSFVEIAGLPAKNGFEATAFISLFPNSFAALIAFSSDVNGVGSDSKAFFFCSSFVFEISGFVSSVFF